MKKILLQFDITVNYNQHQDNWSSIRYEINEYINDDYTLKEALEYIYKLYDIKIGKEQEKSKIIYLTEYIFGELWGNNITYNNKKVYSTKVKNLNNIFGISDRILKIDYISGIGGTSGDIDGIKFFFHTNEKDLHHRRHIHCIYSGEEMRINLDTLEVMDKPFKNKKKVRRCMELIEMNQEKLIEMWDKIVIYGLPFKFKMES